MINSKSRFLHKQTFFSKLKKDFNPFPNIPIKLQPYFYKSYGYIIDSTKTPDFQLMKGWCIVGWIHYLDDMIGKLNLKIQISILKMPDSSVWIPTLQVSIATFMHSCVSAFETSVWVRRSSPISDPFLSFLGSSSHSIIPLIDYVPSLCGINLIPTLIRML